MLLTIRFPHALLDRWVRAIAVLLMFITLTLGNGALARAEVRTHLETPTQMLYQSRQTLRDRDRHTWQAIAFKRITPHDETLLYLRLVSFPGSVDIDQDQPLILRDTIGQTHQAPTAIDELFTQGRPGNNVGQYRLTAALAALQGDSPQWLVIPTSDGSLVELKAPPIALREWRAIAQCHSFTCSDPAWQQTPDHLP